MHSSQTNRSSNEIDIYSIVIGYIAHRHGRGPFSVYSKSTCDYPPAPEKSISIEKSVVSDFVLKCENEVSLEEYLPNDDVNCKVVQDETIDRIFNNKSPETAWKEYYKAFPDSRGVLYLSRIGLNEKGDKSLVYAAFGKNHIHGHGTYFYFEKIGRIWRIIKCKDIFIN